MAPISTLYASPSVKDETFIIAEANSALRQEIPITLRREASARNANPSATARYSNTLGISGRINQTTGNEKALRRRERTAVFLTVRSFFIARKRRGVSTRYVRMNASMNPDRLADIGSPFVPPLRLKWFPQMLTLSGFLVLRLDGNLQGKRQCTHKGGGGAKLTNLYVRIDSKDTEFLVLCRGISLFLKA